MNHYIISDKKKTVYVDYDNATPEERERASYIARANGYLLKTKFIKAPRDKDTKALEKEFLLGYLKGADLEEFKNNCDSSKTHIATSGRKKGQSVKNTYLYAVSVVSAKHPNWKEEFNKQ